MPRTNSESDFGGSLTSDESDVDLGPSSPVQPTSPRIEPLAASQSATLNIDTYVNPTVAISPPNDPPVHSPLKSPKSPRPILHENSFSNMASLTGAARFRATVRKVMAMRKTSTYLGAFRGAGAEPGIDPRRPSAMAAYGHLKEACSIQVVDYSSIRAKFREFDNKAFIRFLAERGTEKEEWAKVRWIAIGGISWDVISALALTYELHPLSLEDIFHRRNGHIRSKADYFSKHLFIRILCHALGDPDTMSDPLMSGSARRNITDAPRSSSPTRFDESTEKVSNSPETTLRNRPSILKGRTSTSRETSPRTLEEAPSGGFMARKHKRRATTAEALAALELLKNGERVPVDLKNLFMFLLRDGTFITIHQTNSSELVEPIISRLRTRDTVLRSTADPSLLLESIVDLVVDQAVEVVEEYQKMILKLERDILLKPKMNSVRRLHILSGDLSSHKRTLEPLKSLVYGLRRYDLDRCIAVAASSAEGTGQTEDSRKIAGYMSHKSKVYLADVHDHVDYILTSMELFAGVAENLINYTFNTASYQMNETMRLFTLVTIIFLPLTFLSGYFGMNFTNFDAIIGSDLLFWKITLPILAGILPLLFWSDLVRMKHYMEKKTAFRHLRGKVTRD